MLPVIAAALDQQVAEIGELLPRLEEGRTKPHVFDRAGLERMAHAFSEAVEHAENFEKQARNWRAKDTAGEHREAIDHVERQASRLRDGARTVVKIARELEHGCIDTILEMSDEELGVAVMTGKLDHPGGQ